MVLDTSENKSQQKSKVWSTKKEKEKEKKKSLLSGKCLLKNRKCFQNNHYL